MFLHVVSYLMLGFYDMFQSPGVIFIKIKLIIFCFQCFHIISYVVFYWCPCIVYVNGGGKDVNSRKAIPIDVKYEVTE